MKAEIIYLSKSDLSTIQSLEKSLNSFHLNFNNKFSYPIRIFVEKDFPEEYKNKLFTQFKLIRFQEIEFPSVNFEIKDKTNFSYGYRHMCKFFYNDVLEHLYDLDWYMRLDTDSYITKEINYDIFEFLDTNGFNYAYVAEMLEETSVCIGMDKFFINLCKSNNINQKFLNYLLDENGNYTLRQIYNNFEVKRLDFFKNKINQSIIKEVVNSNYIYHYRWGDAPLTTFTLSLTCDRDKIYRFKDINYIHQCFSQTDGKIQCRNTPSKWIEDDDWISI